VSEANIELVNKTISHALFIGFDHLSEAEERKYLF